MKFLKLVKKGISRVILFILSISLIILLLYLFNYNIAKNSKTEMQDYMGEIRGNAIFILKNEISHFKSALEQEAHVFSRFKVVDDVDIIKELQNCPKERSVARMNIFTKEGKYYSSYDGSIKQYDPQIYSDSINNDAAAISQPRMSHSMNRMIVEIAIPLYIGGEHKGILIGSYAIDDFQELLANNFLDGDCSISLARANGDMISRTGKVSLPDNFKENIFDFYFRDDVVFSTGTPAAMQKEMLDGKSGYVVYTNDGLERYISYAPVGINDWYIAAGSTGKTMTARTYKTKLYASRLVIGVCCVMLFLAISIIIIRAKEQRAMREILKKMADTDLLTNILNKTATEYSISEYLKTAGKSGAHAFLMIDIDGFKNINDYLGHSMGDKILSDLGNDLQDIFRNDDIVGRVGGDEFAVLIKNYGDIETVEEKANKIREALRKIHYIDGDESASAPTSASIGIALYPQNGADFTTLYRNADKALYESKNGGRDRQTFFK